jgi:hypothetical protein
MQPGKVIVSKQVANVKNKFRILHFSTILTAFLTVYASWRFLPLGEEREDGGYILH